MIIIEFILFIILFPFVVTALAWITEHFGGFLMFLVKALALVVVVFVMAHI